MELKIALAGNPNCGKTTLFNALTGSNQYVGNWPGVTVEKKEGRYKEDKEVVIQDLPGIYSLSPYTLEEVVARDYLIGERPDAILNLVDGTNVERNLYLTTQLLELGIPVVVALNMMDVVRRAGDRIDTKALSAKLGVPVVEISALKGEGIREAMERVEAAARAGRPPQPLRTFAPAVERALDEIEQLVGAAAPERQRRFYAIKLFERDAKVMDTFRLDPAVKERIEQATAACERALDDDGEAIITDQRYGSIREIVGAAVHKRHTGETVSDRIDRVVTHRVLALPIFAIVMTLVYYISWSSLGTILTDWANDGVFGDGWHALGIGSAAYAEASETYELALQQVDAYIAAAETAGVDTAELAAQVEAGEVSQETADAFGAAAQEAGVTASVEPEEGKAITVDAAAFTAALAVQEPDPADYGVWIPGIPVLVGAALEAVNCADWLQSLILDGVIGGVGGVLGFVPQMLVLFLLLAFLEDCGYMARVAFIMDRIFRRFGLSGKSFIPMLIGTGCGVPGVMASRTIEQDRDRKMTIMTTTFIPCGAKMPIVGFIAGAMFGGAWWVAPSAYFVGVAAIIISGILLKKTRRFAGEPAPFVMELPAYHWPTLGGMLRSMWERGWSFIKRAGTVIFAASILVWVTSNLGFTEGRFGLVEDMDASLLAAVGGIVAPLFAPLGFGNWQSSVATILGLVAKEEVVGTFGALYGVLGDALAIVESGDFAALNPIAVHFTALSAYSFLVFNLLCAPCFAAIGAMKREFNNAGWTWFAIGYQTGFAYAMALIVYQLGMLLTGHGFTVWTAVALAVLAGLCYLVLRPSREREMRRRGAMGARA